MSKPLKIVLLALGGSVVLAVVVGIAVFLFVDVASYKPELEAAASSALGMEVEVGGRVGVNVFPGLIVSLEDVHVSKEQADVASAARVDLGIELLPLLRRQVRLDRVTLAQPMTSIERDLEGRFNFEKLELQEALRTARKLTNVSLTDWTLRYHDQQSGAALEADGCTLDVAGPRLVAGPRSELMRNVSLDAELACREIRTEEFTLSDLRLSAAGKDGIFDLEPLTMRLLGGNGSGRIRGDFTGGVPRYDIDYALPQFRIEEFFEVRSLPQKAAGAMDFAAKLSLQGKTVTELRSSIEGQITLRGEQLTLNGIDLDQQIERFEASQNFNLVDVGAFFLVGPFGLVATRAYNFASVLQGSEGTSEIERLVSDWTVTGGVAGAEDVALATRKNRIALQGKLNFVNDRFEDVTIAVVDGKGCVEARQGIRGPFLSPEVETVSIFRSIMGPAIELLEKGRDLFPDDDCEVFYAGSVVAPE